MLVYKMVLFSGDRSLVEYFKRMKKDETRWLRILLFFSPPERCKIFLFWMRPSGLMKNKKILHREGGEKNNKIWSHLVKSFFISAEIISTRLRSPLNSAFFRENLRLFETCNFCWSSTKIKNVVACSPVRRSCEAAQERRLYTTLHERSFSSLSLPTKVGCTGRGRVSKVEFSLALLRACEHGVSCFWGEEPKRARLYANCGSKTEARRV